MPLQVFSASLFFLVAAGCPLTDEETQIANYIKQREDRVTSGEIATQIAANTYTADSLSNDMYRWWVQIGLAGQNSAIENFVNLMQDAKQKAQKADWLSVVNGWLGQILGAIGPEVAVLAKANAALSAALHTWQTAAGSGDGDFLTLAMQFRADLPTQETTQLLLVDNFINEVKNIPATDYDVGLLAAYSQVTKVIASTISYRRAFNEYYIRFLEGANMGDLAFYYSWNAGGSGGKPKNVIWTLTPGGLAACTVANFVHDLNLGCVSTQTPGFENITTGVQISVNQGPAVGLQLSCSDLDRKKFTGCWVQGQLINNGNCITVYEQAKGASGWPPQEVTDFCTNMITSTTSYTACNPDGDSGPANCQHNPNLYSCEASISKTNTTTELIV